MKPTMEPCLCAESALQRGDVELCALHLAAPELLAALREIVNAYNNNPSLIGASIPHARKAIVKAGGRK